VEIRFVERDFRGGEEGKKGGAEGRKKEGRKGIYQSIKWIDF
jgi:hypothetical protein